MKNFTFSLKVLLVGMFFTGAVTAQTTIVEMDGSNNEFDPNDWLITADLGFSNQTEIVIQSGESGTLSLSNTSYYSDIQVEVRFSQGGAIPITFESVMTDGTTPVNGPGTITTDANTPKVGTYSFGNASGYAISSLTISNLSMNGTIVYLKISGTLESGGSSEIPEEVANGVFVYSGEQMVTVESNIDGKMELYTLSGKRILSENIQKGRNDINVNENGMYLVTITNRNNNVIKRSKVVVK